MAVEDHSKLFPNYLGSIGKSNKALKMYEKLKRFRNPVIRQE